MTMRPVQLLRPLRGTARPASCLPACAAEIVDGTGQRQAWVALRNPLLSSGPEGLHSDARDEQARWIVTGSGTLADEAFVAEPRNWMGPGRAALDRLVERAAAEIAGTSMRWLLTPHCRDVLSDVQGVRRFLLDHADAPIGIALNPAALFERGMLRHVEDHMTRIVSGLGPVCALIMLQDIAPGAADHPEARVELCAPGDGLLPWAHMAGLLRRHVPSDTPIVLRAEDVPGTTAQSAAQVAERLGLI